MIYLNVLTAALDHFAQHCNLNNQAHVDILHAMRNLLCAEYLRAYVRRKRLEEAA